MTKQAMNIFFKMKFFILFPGLGNPIKLLLRRTLVLQQFYSTRSTQ